MNNKNKQTVNKTMQSVTSNQTCGGCAGSQSFTKSCGEEAKPCSHTNTVSWGNRFGSGINCYDCGFSLDKNRTVIPGSNMVNCRCGQVLKADAYFSYKSETYYCDENYCGYIPCSSCGERCVRDSRDHDHMICDENGDMWFCVECYSNGNAADKAHRNGLLLMGEDEDERYQECEACDSLTSPQERCGHDYCDECVLECCEECREIHAEDCKDDPEGLDTWNLRKTKFFSACIIQRAWRKYSLKPFKCCGTFYGECSKTCYRDDEDDFLRGSSCNANGYGPEQWVCKDCDVVEGYSVFVSSDDCYDDYIVSRIFKDYKEAEAFFEKMKLEHPNCMNIEFEGNLFDAQADFYPYDDLDNHNPIVDTFKLIDGFGPYHTESDWETIQKARLHRKKFSSCLKFLKEEPAEKGGANFKKERFNIEKVEPEESESELDEDGYPYDRCDKCGEILPRQFDWITRPNGRCYDCVPECETNDDEDVCNEP